jgi:dihydroorotate dehydrogenase electron transfer subunit
MSSPSPSCTTVYQQAEIVAHEQIAEATWRIRIDCPDLARAARPGQFAMVRLANQNDPLLARPLAVYDVFGHDQVLDHWQQIPAPADCRDQKFVDFIYAVAGKFTTALTSYRPGDCVSLWGPLGNGFQTPAVNHLVLVAGGIGQTALLMLGRDFLAKVPSGHVTFCWGARHANLFGHAEDFTDHGMRVRLATLDGSKGHRGTVVDLLDNLEKEKAFQINEPPAIACCGPEGMMAAVAKWTANRSIKCQVSLETPMACGIGICFSCVAPVIDKEGNWDYRRTCIEGPIFDSQTIDWDAMI